MSDQDRTTRSSTFFGMRPSVAAFAGFLRGLPLVFRASPRTPLRVLAIIAIDTLHMLRQSKPLPRKSISELAMLLDFQACTNAAWDRKDRCIAEHDAIRQQLEKAGLSSCIEAYLSRLHELENDRPSPGGDRRHFDEVRLYREAVVRLSLATAIAMDGERLDEEIRATHGDSNVAALFRIVMQCQIIDDVIDYAADQSAGLPSFLTATASLPQALALTANTARDYAERENSSGNAAFPLRMAVNVCSAMATLVVRVAHRWHRAAVLGGSFAAARARHSEHGLEMVKGKPDG